jgi:hypothetical protein
VICLAALRRSLEFVHRGSLISKVGLMHSSTIPNVESRLVNIQGLLRMQTILDHPGLLVLPLQLTNGASLLEHQPFLDIYVQLSTQAISSHIH